MKYTVYVNMKNAIVCAIIFIWLGDTANAFTCQQQGIFVNTDSNDCKTFVMCTSNLSPTVYNCEDNTYFWPEKKGCFSQYNCATNSVPGNINPCEGYSWATIPDKTSVDCSKYIVCSMMNIYNSGEYVQLPQAKSEQCSSGTAYRPGYGCVNDYQCVDYQCTSDGIFKNPNDCSTFIQCQKYYTSSNTGQVTSFFPDLINCPANTKFNPNSKKCDYFYNCDGNDPYGGVDPCFEYNHDNPFVSNPFDSSASSYLVCRYSFYGSIGSRDVILKQECPANTLFSQLLGKCYNNYIPNETCSKDPCSSGPGKYVHYKSGHCDSFIECRNEARTLELYKPTYEIRYCPDGTRYSPELSDCSREYTCPTFPVNYCYPQIPTTTAIPTTTTLPPSGTNFNASDHVNHAMLLLGYTPDYWILKNWWGSHWGNEGYMKIKRGVNQCGISNFAAYAVV